MDVVKEKHTLTLFVLPLLPTNLGGGCDVGWNHDVDAC